MKIRRCKNCGIDISHKKKRATFCSTQCVDACKKGRPITHGMCYSRFYKTYRGLMDRCLSPHMTSFEYYGGRGIKSVWMSFEEFKDDMHESYLEHCKKFGEKNTTIDRIDNNKNYCKENCRWATPKEQANNRRNNRTILFDGVEKTISTLAHEKGIKPNVLWQRIIKYNWSLERATKI